MILNKATIIGFYGSWGSGMATLKVIKDKTGEQVDIPCDNGPTVRALDSIFDGFISRGHTINNSAIKGKTIFYKTDDMGLGLLDGILPENYCDYCNGSIDCDECPIEVN